LLTLKGHFYSVDSVAFSPDGRRIVTGSNDAAKVWETHNGKELFTLNVGRNVISVAFSPDGRRIATGSADATVKVWDADSGKELLALNAASSVNSVAFSPDGRRIVTGSTDAITKVWDVQSAEELLTFKGHSSSVMSVAFSLDGRRIVTGSTDTTAKVWNVADTPSPSVSPNDTGAQNLTKVFVKKYSFSVLLPTELFPDAAAKLADANTDRVVSVNGCFRVAFNVLSTPVKEAYDNCLAEFRKKGNHITIDYKVLKDTWFVVSGDSDTTGYYTKGVKRGDNVIVMQLEYTGSACNLPDAMLTEISRKFDGN
jgi:WD40 repeat protein